MQSILFSSIFKLKVRNFLKKVILIIELNELLLIFLIFKFTVFRQNFACHGQHDSEFNY